MRRSSMNSRGTLDMPKMLSSTESRPSLALGTLKPARRKQNATGRGNALLQRGLVHLKHVVDQGVGGDQFLLALDAFEVLQKQDS